MVHDKAEGCGLSGSSQSDWPRVHWQLFVHVSPSTCPCMHTCTCLNTCRLLVHRARTTCAQQVHACMQTSSNMHTRTDIHMIMNML